MTDQPDPTLDPEQESTVRRLLAEARHDQPVPAEVAERLDRVLAGLSRDDEAPAVIDLATRRRRRNAGRLLVAAAAVIVAGVGVGQVIGTGAGSDDADTAGSASGVQASAPERSSGDDGQATQDLGGGQEAATPAPQGSSAAPYQAFKDGLPLELSSQRFARDVRRSVGQLSSAATSVSPGRDELGAVPGFDCPTAAPYGDGMLLPAYYDGVPSVLALRPPEGTEQLAELLQCGTAIRVRSFNLRVR